MGLFLDAVKIHFDTESQSQRYLHHLKYKAEQILHCVQDKVISAMNRGDFSHIHRHKTLFEFARLSGAVCGIEFCYAAETAFVSPILLSLGIQMRFMTLIWCIPPLVGFFITPLIGSLSDSCRSRLGRRRPFIILLSFGILSGLILVPNGRDFGFSLGDHDYTLNVTQQNANYSYVYNFTENQDVKLEKHRPWGIVFTVVGVVLLDFCSDACQSPARTYLLDVTLPEDHARGLSVFTILGGIGGSIGYAMGGINWSNTYIATLLGSHERPVFTFVAIIFFICVVTTITSFKEIPLDLIYQRNQNSNGQFFNEEPCKENVRPHQYGSLDDKRDVIKMTSLDSTPSSASLPPEQSTLEVGASEESGLRSPTSKPPLKLFLKSIFFLPKSVKILCLTHLFCWMSLVSYSLYFTNFVGEVVFGGDPRLRETDPGFQKYQDGVRFGCWGMACSLLSCAIYSYFIERLVKRFGETFPFSLILRYFSSPSFKFQVVKNK